jgi:signal transduction histidine kinase
MAEIEHGEFTVRKQLIQNFYEDVILPAITGLKERYPYSFESYDTSMGGVGAIRLEGDPALLEIVYRNLFGNALKYSNPGGKLAYGFVDQGDSFLFNVWNSGPGVEPHLVERIFDKFYRVRDDSTKAKRGTGLGLYNVRKIIEAHGGRIWCETKPGEWINFLFVLPKK